MSTSPTVQAVCPGFQHPLRIPRELVGKPVKCKKCGTVVRSKAKPEGDPSRRKPVAAAGVLADDQHVVLPRAHEGNNDALVYRPEDFLGNGIRLPNGALGLFEAQTLEGYRRDQRQRRLAVLANGNWKAQRRRLRPLLREVNRGCLVPIPQDPFNPNS